MVLDPDRHRTEALQKTTGGSNGPPVIQEHLERTPHCNPPTDQATFANDVAHAAPLKVASDGVADRDGRREKRERDSETDAPTPKQLPKSSPASQQPLTEVLVNCPPQNLSFVRSAGGALQMHHQGPRPVHSQVTRPADDEFLGARIEITLTEGRGVDGVE